MSERETYPAGVPCWVETLQPDVDAALDFYRAVFEWDFVGPGDMPGDPPGRYFVAQVRGRDVAGIGSRPRDTPTAWNTHISVDDLDTALGRWTAAGGSIVEGPIDAAPAGRTAVVTDPSGAVSCLWQAQERAGAQRINEPSCWAMSVLRTGEADRARAFYAQVFGWNSEPVDPAGGPFIFRLPGFVGGEEMQPVPRDVVAVLIPAESAEPSVWAVNFWHADTAAAAARVTELGGRVVDEPRDDGMFLTAVLADPQGAVFSISQLMTDRLPG